MLNGATLSCMFFMFKTFLHFKSLNYNRHMSFIMKSFIDRIQEFKDIGRTAVL